MEVEEYKEEDYRTIFGVERETFNQMLKIVTKEYENIHKKGAEKMEQHLKND